MSNISILNSMQNIPQIQLGNHWVDIRIHPDELTRLSRTQFKKNHRKLVDKLAQAYSLKVDVSMNRCEGRMIGKERADVILDVNIKNLYLSVRTFAKSREKAWKIMAVQVHRKYKSLIKF